MRAEISEIFFVPGFNLSLSPTLLAPSLKDGLRRNTFQISLS